MNYTLADIIDRGLIYLSTDRIVWESILLKFDWTDAEIQVLCDVVEDNIYESPDGERIDWPAVQREWTGGRNRPVTVDC